MLWNMDLVYNSVCNSVQKFRNKKVKLGRIYGTHASSTVLLFSRQTDEPRINITSTQPSNQLSIGAAINLTCIAWQTEQLPSNPMTKPYRIEWFDPQDKPIGSQCNAKDPPTGLMKCTLQVGALTQGKPGNYTCRARNFFNHCITKKIRIGPQGKEKKREWSVAEVVFRGVSVSNKLWVNYCTLIKIAWIYWCARNNIHPMMSSPSSVP